MDNFLRFESTNSYLCTYTQQLCASLFFYKRVTIQFGHFGGVDLPSGDSFPLPSHKRFTAIYSFWSVQEVWNIFWLIFAASSPAPILDLFRKYVSLLHFNILIEHPLPPSVQIFVFVLQMIKYFQREQGLCVLSCSQRRISFSFPSKIHSDLQVSGL